MVAQKVTSVDPSIAFFPVELRPLFMEINEEKDDRQQELFPSAREKYKLLPRHFAVVDIEKDHPFAVVTNDYELVTNEDAYHQASDIMKKVFQNTKKEDMFCMNVTMPKTRSFCHIDLVHKSTEFSPWEKDKWTAFLRITNSYNRTRLLRFEIGFCRWICLNGMIFGNKSIEFSYAHTRHGGYRVNRFIENIKKIRELENQLTEKLHQLQRYYVPKDSMLPILCKAFDIQVLKDVYEKPKRVETLIAFRNQTQKITEFYFSQMGPHGYAALNVLTDYATRPEGVISPESSMHSLQEKCGNWTNDFISAISSNNFSFDRYLEDYRKTASIIEGL